MHRSSTRRLHSIPLHLLSASLLFTQALFIQAGAAQSAMVESALSTQEREIVSWIADQEDDMVALLERLTNINTGTLNKAGVAEVVGLLNTELLQSIGFGGLYICLIRL